MRPQAVLFVLLIATTAVSRSEVYKWVDEKGVTHFSELPPPGQPATRPRQQPAAPQQPLPAAATGGDDARPAGKTWQQKETEFRQRQIERDAAARRQQEQEEAAQRRQHDCLLARKSLENLQNANAVSRYDHKGQRVYLDDAERAKLIQSRRQEIESRCAGQ